MYALDTDTLSNFLDLKRDTPRLRERLLSTPLDELAITIVTVEEMLRGALDAIRRAQTRRRDVTVAYADLQILVRQLRRFEILPFGAEAERIYTAFPAAFIRRGANDCRIAAIALANGATLVTSNAADFRGIPGLSLESWTWAEMKLKLHAGTTSKLLRVFVQDATKSDGSGLTGLTSASAGLVWRVLREGDGAPGSVALAAGAVGAWSSGGFAEVSAPPVRSPQNWGLGGARVSRPAHESQRMTSLAPWHGHECPRCASEPRLRGLGI